MDYKDAGVDIEAGRDFVGRIRSLVDSTRRPEVLGGLGGFGGLFELPAGYRQPVLVSGTDGVGTKLKIAQTLNRHETIGIDLVAMCVNDVLTCGAEPVFFLDYLAAGKLEPLQLTQVVEGIAEGCHQAGCTLLGGETAEMPGFYSVGEYDLAGFCVGIVEKGEILDGTQVVVGDAVIGIASTGVHSNGFSLVRKVVQAILSDDPEKAQSDWNRPLDALEGFSLAEVLLEPTRIYVQPILTALRSGYDIHAMAHITGGGLPENLPRCLRPGQSVQLSENSWPVPSIFAWLAQQGNIEPGEMFRAFNMGIGFVLIASPSEAESLVQWLTAQNLPAWRIGTVVDGDGAVLGIPQA